LAVSDLPLLPVRPRTSALTDLSRGGERFGAAACRVSQLTRNPFSPHRGGDGEAREGANPRTKKSLFGWPSCSCGLEDLPRIRNRVPSTFSERAEGQGGGFSGRNCIPTCRDSSNSEGRGRKEDPNGQCIGLKATCRRPVRAIDFWRMRTGVSPSLSLRPFGKGGGNADTARSQDPKVVSPVRTGCYCPFRAWPSPQPLSHYEPNGRGAFERRRAGVV